MVVLHSLLHISVDITARINIIGYAISLSVTYLAITHLPFSSGLLGTLLHVTLAVVVDLDVSILVGILAPLRGIFVDLNILGIFVGIGISL